MASPSTPTLAGFLAFLANVVQIPSAALPTDSPVPGYAFNFALTTVNPALQIACGPTPNAWSAYTVAVYNLAADILINWAQDPQDEPAYKNELQYFAWLRDSYGINQFVAGVIQSSSDEGTSQSMVVPDQFKGLTIGQLTNLRTPYGRQFLSISQSFGTLWGLS
jgi:hypothetical protein